LRLVSTAGLKKILWVSWTATTTNEWVLKARVKRELLGHCQSKGASILRSHHEETRELSGERDNPRNNARCTQAKKTTHGLDGQHEEVDTPRGRVYQNDRDKWRKYVHGGPTLGSRTVKEQNSRTVDSNNICLKVNRSARVQRMNNVSGPTLATETAV